MINKLTLLTILLAATASVSSFAQSASATQTLHIQVSPIIQIGNGSVIKGNGKGNNGNGNGNGGNNNNNGNNGNGNNGNGNGNGGGRFKMNSGDFHEFTVNSNKGFIVSVQAANNSTDENILLALADNKTGGQPNPNFSSKYAPVQATSQDLLMNCAFGAEKTFAVNYKANNNKNTKKQSLTKADLIYTATLP